MDESTSDNPTNPTAIQNSKKSISIAPPHCHLCKKPVYTAESLLAAGVTWHKHCFICGGAGTVLNTSTGLPLGCKRTLKVIDYEQYKGWPFCKACFPQITRRNTNILDPQNTENVGANKDAATPEMSISVKDRASKFSIMLSSETARIQIQRRGVRGGIRARASLFKQKLDSGDPFAVSLCFACKKPAFKAEQVYM